MVSHHLAKFGGHRHCGSGDVMFLVVEGQDSTCPCLNLPLLFISKAYDMACSDTLNFWTQTQQFAGVPNEVFPILVTHIYKNSGRNALQKLLAVRPKAALGRRKKTEWQLQSSLLYTQTQK